jgi:hypothetical protein
MNPLTIAVLVIVLMAIPAGIFSWKVWKRHQHAKLVAKHDELFRSVFPSGDEQKDMTRPLLEKTLREVDGHISLLSEFRERLQRLSFSSPLGVDFGLELHSELSNRIQKAQDVRSFVIRVGNESGLNHEDPDEIVDSNPSSATAS